ncbi:hypothetical protein ACLOJK_034339, partial [Asimina triloba]
MAHRTSNMTTACSSPFRPTWAVATQIHLQGSNGKPTRKQQAAAGATSVFQFENPIDMTAIKGKSMARWATLKIADNVKSKQQPKLA